MTAITITRLFQLHLHIKSTPGFADDRFSKENTGWYFYLVKEEEKIAVEDNKLGA